jgi:hypothetical protein
MDSETIGDRIEFLRRQSRKSYNDLALIIKGITADGVNKAIKRNSINDHQIDLLCEELDWNKNWILTGEGDFKVAAKKKSETIIEEDPLFDVLVQKFIKSKLFNEYIQESITAGLEAILKNKKKDYTPEEYKAIIERLIEQAETPTKKK